MRQSFPSLDDEIRQNEGFKNVSLGNVLSAAYSDKRVSFISLEEQVMLWREELVQQARHATTSICMMYCDYEAPKATEIGRDLIRSHLPHLYTVYIH